MDFPWRCQITRWYLSSSFLFQVGSQFPSYLRWKLENKELQSDLVYVYYNPINNIYIYISTINLNPIYSYVINQLMPIYPPHYGDPSYLCQNMAQNMAPSRLVSPSMGQSNASLVNLWDEVPIVLGGTHFSWFNPHFCSWNVHIVCLVTEKCATVALSFSLRCSHPADPQSRGCCSWSTQCNKMVRARWVAWEYKWEYLHGNIMEHKKD